MKKELENLSAADEKLCRMLASLNQAQAPKDFEFRLKARIAGASPKAYRTNYKRRFAYALPASALAIISAFMVINGNFSGDAGQIGSTAAATTESSMTAPLANPSNESVAASKTEIKEPEKYALSIGAGNAADSNSQTEKNKNEESSVAAIPRASEKSKNQTPKALVKPAGGFSEDKSFLPTTKVFRPRGLNPDTKVDTPKDFDRENSFSLPEILSPLGAEVVSENGKWKVKSVSPNSPAQRSGILADDVIETLDGRKLSGAALRGKKVELKKIGVKRGSAQVEINLQANPK
jgi:hypothetical protein